MKRRKKSRLFGNLKAGLREVLEIERGNIEPVSYVEVESPRSKPTTSEAENEKALKVIEALMVKPSLTQVEDEYLEKLFSAVEDFERVAYPLCSEREKGGRY